MTTQRRQIGLLASLETSSPMTCSVVAFPHLCLFCPTNDACRATRRVVAAKMCSIVTGDPSFKRSQDRVWNPALCQRVFGQKQSWRKAVFPSRFLKKIQTWTHFFLWNLLYCHADMSGKVMGWWGKSNKNTWNRKSRDFTTTDVCH